MTLNIISNFAANTALRNLQINGDEAAKSVGKLSSGSRVITAADDAAALAIGTRLNTEVKALETATVNAGQAVSLLQIADGGLNRVQELLTRMKVLAVQSGSDNISNRERNLLDTEFQNLKDEIGRLTGDTKFNGISILGTEMFVQGAGLVAANTNSNLGLRQFDVLSDEVGNDRGIVDISIRGVDNRSVTLGGDGAFTLTIYQDDISISDDTGFSQVLGPGQLSNNLFANPFPGGAELADFQTGLNAETAITNQTNYNVVSFDVDGSLIYRPVEIDTQRVVVEEETIAWGPDVGGGTFASNPVNLYNAVVVNTGTQAVNLPQGVVNNTDGNPATAGQPLTLTAFFEFGDLDGDGANDVIVKKATLDESLIVDGNDPANPNSVILATGVSIVFDNSDADFSSAGGISKETRKNSSFVIAIDPEKATGLNLGDNAAGDLEGLFQGAASGFVQGQFNAHNADSGVVGFDFKVGSGIIRDEDVISVGVGGATLESLGIVQADIRTKTGADSAGETITAALDYLVNIRTDIGASINRLEVAGDNIAISIENQEAARSRLLDLNVAREVARFTSNQLLLDTGVSVLTQAQSLPAEALRLYNAI